MAMPDHTDTTAALSLPDLIASKTKPNCEVCLGTGLVCEEHPKTPWIDTPTGCDCGAPGMPCVCTGLQAEVSRG